jgi:uncharacterized protein
MDFEWDEEKAASNLAKHGFTFFGAARVFADPARLVIDASRAQDGERRSKAVGRVGERVFTVVFTMRGETVRLISARPSNSQERRLYGDRSI